MYYEEQKIGGVWMWRVTSGGGEWCRFSDEQRQRKMREDVLAMAERASRAYYVEWYAMPNMVALIRHELACHAFAAELAQREALR